MSGLKECPRCGEVLFKVVVYCEYCHAKVESEVSEDDRDDLKDKINELIEDNDRLQDELAEEEQKYEELSEQYRQLRQDYAMIESQLRNLQAQYDPKGGGK